MGLWKLFVILFPSALVPLRQLPFLRFSPSTAIIEAYIHFSVPGPLRSVDPFQDTIPFHPSIPQVTALSWTLLSYGRTDNGLIQFTFLPHLWETGWDF